jgi:hypothetical protein
MTDITSGSKKELAISWSCLLCLSLIFAACSTARPVPEPSLSSSEPKPSPNGRNQGYTLLYELLSDEKDVSKILLIKRESSATGDLIREIARTASDARKQLEQFAGKNAAIDLKTHSLPAIEAITRKSIADARAKELLRASGSEFELHLLLTQTEALTYGAHLADVVASQESSSEGSAFLRKLAAKLRDLHHRSVALLSLRRN